MVQFSKACPDKQKVQASEVLLRLGRGRRSGGKSRDRCEGGCRVPGNGVGRCVEKETQRKERKLLEERKERRFGRGSGEILMA